jgi:hypothetical protein
VDPIFTETQSEKTLWRVVNAVEAVLDRVKNSSPTATARVPASQRVSYEDDVVGIVGCVSQPEGNQHKYWTFNLVEKRGRKNHGFVISVSSSNSGFGLRYFNHAASKRVIGHLEGLVALELLAKV